VRQESGGNAEAVNRGIQRIRCDREGSLKHRYKFALRLMRDAY
jgi:hypothetical protein